MSLFRAEGLLAPGRGAAMSLFRGEGLLAPAQGAAMSAIGPLFRRSCGGHRSRGAAMSAIGPRRLSPYTLGPRP